MELGRVAEIDNAKLNNVEKISKINSADKNSKIVQDDEYKKVLGSNAEIDKNEVILDNVQFGYNRQSKDFFVKVVRGHSEHKYPTEDMMKVKASLLKELENLENKK